MDERYKLELVASEPEIVTPVGMTFDREGRLLVIESHTHQNPEDYSGPKHDRVRMFSDSNGDGRLDRWSTFAEGFRHAMNLLARADGAVYLVTRGSVVLLRDNGQRRQLPTNKMCFCGSRPKTTTRTMPSAGSIRQPTAP